MNRSSSAAASPMRSVPVRRAASFNRRLVAATLMLCIPVLLADAGVATAQCPASLPVQGAPPPGPLPVFPADNWWNLDIRSAPVDTNSSSYISFINNGGTRRLHPDFGGEESPGSVSMSISRWLYAGSSFQVNRPRTTCGSSGDIGPIVQV